MQLETRRIGRTDLAVTVLGFGGAQLGAVGDRLSDAEAHEILTAAWERGIRYFDTAPLYGHGLSEKRIGAFLKNMPRDEFVLGTKVGRLLVPEGQGVRDEMMRDSEGLSVRYDYSYAGARASIEASLVRLGMDRVDVLLCHDIDRWTHGTKQTEIFSSAARGILPALMDLRAEGVVGAVGLGVNEAAVCERVLSEFDVDCFLLAGRFTLLEQDPLDALLPMCQERGVSIIVGGPYNSGLLANVKRRRATYNYKPVDDVRWERAQRLRAVCDAHGVDLRAAALQYPLRHSAVAAVIPGMWSLAEVDDNRSFVGTDIPDALWRDLTAQNLVRDPTAN